MKENIIAFGKWAQDNWLAFHHDGSCYDDFFMPCHD